MSDLRDAATLLTSIKTAYDLAKALFDVRGAVRDQEKVFELQRVILAAQEGALAAQQAQGDLLSRIHELESLKPGTARKRGISSPSLLRGLSLTR